MEEIKKDIYLIREVELLPVIMEKKNDMWRLVQICCAFVEDKYEITYSFAKGYEISNYRLVVDKDERVASISRVYKSAIFYENEMRELFGLKVEHIKVDMHNKLYRIDAETPFVAKKEEE
ncbi:MAG: NADH-quinone oxidoreductase subunit C [Agathobacter sp.]|nr:NADH-quinone oxidoreductase subunit C [Agathobacter sp.]